MQKKKSLNKTVEILYKKMQELDIQESSGIILLKTGLALKIESYFQYLLSTWSDYKLAKATNNEKVLERIMKKTGGIISNGEVNIDMDAVIGMISIIHEQENDDEELLEENNTPFIDMSHGDSQYLPNIFP